METIREWTELKAQCEDVMLSMPADTRGYEIVVSMYADMLAIEMGVAREHPHEEITLFAQRLARINAARHESESEDEHERR